MATHIQVRRATAEAFTLINPVLASGEPGLETDTRKVKYGDGVTAWNDLQYSGGGVETVAGRAGNVVLNSADITDFSSAASAAAPVQSVNGQTGNVTVNVPVQSVAGRTGNVTIGTSDISGFNTAASAAAPVQSVAGRTGNVVLTAADVSGAPSLPSYSSWTASTPPIYGQSVAYGNNVFVAVGLLPNLSQTSTAIYSTDGITWTMSSLPFTANWRQVAFGNGVFVAVTTNGGAHATSTDGITWTSRSAGLPSTYALTFGNGVFVTIGTNTSTALVSTNGITWTSVAVPSNQSWNAAGFALGKIIFFGGNSNVGVISTDGYTWTQISAPVSLQWRNVSGNEKVAVVTGSGGTITSVDGINWTQTATSGGYGVAYGNGFFVVVMPGTNFLVSQDGYSWITKTNVTANTAWRGIAYGNGRFVAVGGSSASAASVELLAPASAGTDVATLLTQARTTAPVQSVAGRTGAVTLTDSDVNFSSVYKNNWNTFTTPDSGVTTSNGVANVNWFNVVYGGGLFWAASGSKIATSTDGVTWTIATSFTADSNYYLAGYGNGKFFTDKLSSADGVSWTSVSSSPNTGWTFAYSAAGNGAYVFMDQYGRFSRSTDAIAYTYYNQNFDYYRLIGDLIYANGKFWAIAEAASPNPPANSTRVLYSTDGLSWTTTYIPDFSGSSYSNAIKFTYGNGYFIAVSSTANIVRRSADGLTWTNVTMPATTGTWGGVSFGNGAFVVGNSVNSDCAISYDNGDTWSKFTVPSSFGGRKPAFGAGRFVFLNNRTSGVYSGPGNAVQSVNGQTGNVTVNTAALSLTGGTTITRTGSTNFLDLTYGNGLLVAFFTLDSNGAKTVDVFDGTSWNRYTTFTFSGGAQKIVYGNGVFVVSYTSGPISGFYVSNSTASTWTQTQTYNGTGGFSALTFGAGKFVALMSNSTNVLLSYNGTTWLGPNYLPVTANWRDVVYGNDKFVAVSYSSTAVTSPDGITWTQRTLPASETWSSIAYGAGLFVAITQNTTTTATSPDGITWTQRTLPVNGTKIIYVNNMFVVVVNNGNTVLTSYDGINWSQVSLPVSSTWCAATYANNQLKILSTAGVIYSSNTLPLFYPDVNDFKAAVTAVAPVKTINNKTGAVTVNDITAVSFNNYLKNFNTAPVPSRNYGNGAYGNGTYVVVSDAGTLTSLNGVTWTSTNTTNLNRCVFGNGVFVAIKTYTGNIYTSSNGVTWTQRTTPISTSFIALTYGNGLFVLVADVSSNSTTNIATSPDGVTWTARTVPNFTGGWAGGAHWGAVAYGNGKFVAVTQEGASAYSADGITWTQGGGVPDGASTCSLAYGNGLFAAVSGSGYYNGGTAANFAAISSDGINWTKSLSMPISAVWGSICFNDDVGAFYAVPSSGTTILASYDCMTWTSATLPFSSSWGRIFYANKLFVIPPSTSAAGLLVSNSGIVTSVNGAAGAVDLLNANIVAALPAATWAETTLPTSGNWTGVAYGNGTFVAVIRASTTAATSPDGVTWTQRTLPGPSNWSAIAYGNGVFVTLGQTSNVAATSSDGITWGQNYNLSFVGISLNWSSIAYGNGIFVALASGAGVAGTSPDGVTWTQRTLPTSASWCGVAYGNGLFVAVSSGSQNAATSPDGVTWTSRLHGQSSGVAGIAYGNGFFVAPGSGSTTGLKTTDGVTWTTVIVGTTAAAGVTYGNGTFVVFGTSGNGNDIITSQDGVNWTTRSSGTLNAVAYGDGVFIGVRSYSAVASMSSSPSGRGHTHGNITTTGAIGSTSGQVVVTTTSGVLTTAATVTSSQLPAATNAALGGVIVGTGLGISSGTVSVSYGTTSTTACVGNDSRLSDARTPLSHTHGNITNAGAIGSTSGLPVITTTSGVLTTGTFSTTAGTFCQGNDSRLSDARNPLATASSVAHGSSSTTKTLSATAAVQTCSLSANCTFTMPTATASDFVLVLTQTGSFTATFTGVKWPGGVSPTITTGANKVDIIRFVSDGTSWYGQITQNY